MVSPPTGDDAVAYQSYETQLLGPLWRVLDTAATATREDSDAELSQCTTSVLLSLLQITTERPETTLEAVVARMRAVSEALLVQQATPPPPSSQAHDGVVSSAAAAALTLERLFVQLCTTVQSYVALHVPRDKAATPPSAAAGELPAGVRRAVRGIAEGVFALQYSGIPRHHPRSDRVIATRQLQPLVQSLWFSFQFLLLQQLATRNTDVTPWQRFFSGCRDELTTRVARPATFTDDEDEEDEADGEDGAADKTREGTGLTTMQCEEVQLAACRALGCISGELMGETVARARFRRTALRFRSFLPHMFSQAPTTTFVMIDLLLRFSEDWRRAMQRLPPGTMSAAAQSYFVGDTLTSGEDGEASEEAGCEEALTEAQRDAERALRQLVETYSARWRALLEQSCPHGYLLTTVLGAVLCALYILPCSRSGTSGGGGGSGSKSSAASTAAATRPTIIRNRPTLATLHASAAMTSMSGMGEAARTAGSSAVVTPDVMAALATASTLSWLPARALEQCGEAEWRLREFAPLGLLLRHKQPVDTTHFLRTHLFYFSTQLYIGFASAHHVDGRQKLALCALLTGLCDLTTAMAIYHYAADPPAPYTGQSGKPSDALLPPHMLQLPAAALQAYTALTERYAKAAHSELVLPPQAASSVMAMMNHTAPAAVFASRYGRNGSTPMLQSLSGGVASAAAGGGAVLQDRHTTTSTAPHHGELVGERFCRMVYDAPVPPSWSQFIADNYGSTTSTVAPSAQAHTGGGATGTQARVTSPCRFVLDLLSVRCHGVAARCIEALQREQHANVFLVPRRGLLCGVSVQTYVVHSLTRWLDAWSTAARRPARTHAEDGDDAAALGEQERVLADYAPLLRLCQTYVASQTFLAALLERLVAFCTASSAGVGREDGQAVVAERVCGAPRRAAVARPLQRRLRRRFALVEELLVGCVMPCMRVLAPSHVLYDGLQAIFASMRRASAAVGYGVGEGQFLHMDVWCARLLPSARAHALLPPPLSRGRAHDGAAAAARADSWTPRYPHDVVRTTELHALFLQCLRRVNAARATEYRRLLRHVFFADPLFVAERLLLQAVGYENNFLAVHTALLHGLPEAIVTLIVQLGLALLDRHAASEKLEESGQSKAGLIATFLATLWCARMSEAAAAASCGAIGDVLLQAAERALRTYSRAGLVKGMHLLKALFFQCLHSKPEHEERFSAAQLHALGLPRVTRFFARGSMESFRVTRWSAETSLTPVDLDRARGRLVCALQQPCAVPIEPPPRRQEQRDDSSEIDDDEEEANVQRVVLPIGQHLLLHLCRLQGQIHHLQADLEGGMELVQLTSAKDYNVLTDLALGLADLLAAGPPQALLARVAMPHLALRLAGFFAVRAQLEPPSVQQQQQQQQQQENSAQHRSDDDGDDDEGAWAWLRAASTAVPFALQRLLSRCVAMHFVYDEAPYLAAQREVRACMAKAQACNTMGSAGAGTAAVASREVVRWLLQQAQHIEREQAWHKTLYAAGSTTALRDEVWAAMAQSVLHAEPVGFVVSYLLPRALLSFEDAIFVCGLLRWFMARAAPADKPRVVDLVFCLVTAAATFFVGLTDAECTRVGHVIAELVCLVDALAPMPPLPVEVALEQSATASEGTAQRRTLPASSGKAVQDTRKSGDVAGPADDAEDEVAVAQFASYLRPTPRSLFAATAPKQQQQGGTTPHHDDTAGATGLQMPQASSHRTEADMPAYPLQLEAFLCRFALQVLLRVQDVPAFVQRNMLAILTALVKKDAVFPRTAQGCVLLSYAVALHADETRQNYASASAVLKTLRGQLRRRRQGVMQLSTTLAQLATRMTNAGNGGSAQDDAARQETTVQTMQAALRVRRMSEQYMQRQLAPEMVWCDRHRAGQMAAAAAAAQPSDATRMSAHAAHDESDEVGSSSGGDGGSDNDEMRGETEAEDVVQAEDGIAEDDEERHVQSGDEGRGRSASRRSASRASSHQSSSARSPPASSSAASSRGSSQPQYSSSSSACAEEQHASEDDGSARDAAEGEAKNSEDEAMGMPPPSQVTGQSQANKRPRSGDEGGGEEDDSSGDDEHRDMQATLLFRFPHLPREVRVELLVPHPAERPKTVANFLYMVTGTLPSSEVMQALHLPPTARTFAAPDELRVAGLRPFSETAVVHIDKGVVLEIGSSTTRTIFGGFLADEPMTTAATTPANDASAHGAAGEGVLTRMAARAPGTVLCGNAGMPHTQASRYYILLDTVTQGSTKRPGGDEDWHSFAPLGFVTSGLDALCRAAAHTAVHPRTLAPLKAIKLSGCSVVWDTRRAAAASAGTPASPSAAQVGLEARRAQLRDAATKRARQADDFYDDKDEEETRRTNAQDDDKAHGETLTATADGFFRVEARFPLAGRNVDQDARLVKRRRTEGGAVYDDDDADNAAPVTMAHVSQDKPFDFFAAQEAAFASDLDSIRDVQHVRQRHRQKRGAKSKVYGGGAQHPRRRDAEGGGKRAATATHTKKLRRRY